MSERVRDTVAIIMEKGSRNMWRKPCPPVLSAQQIPHGQQCSSFLCKLPRFICPILTSFNWINKIYDKSSM